MNRTMTADGKTTERITRPNMEHTVRRWLGMRWCWCLRCMLTRTGLYRQRRICYQRATWIRTTFCGIRLGGDRWMHDEPA